MSSDQKLDLVLQELAAVKLMQQNIEKVVTRVSTLETTVAAQALVIKSQEETIKTLVADVKTLKEKTNAQDQHLKSNAVRLFNFPGSNDETGLHTKVYDRILKPILVAAKAKGDLATVPQLKNVIKECFRAGCFAAGSNKPPPPVIIKFISPAVRLAILKNKRTNTPSPSEAEKALGLKKFALAKDLTTPTYRKLQELQKEEGVSKAWAMGGEIWFVKNEENSQPRKVKSVYDPIGVILS